MMAFRRAARFGDLWNGDMSPCTVDGRKVLIVRINDAVYAYEDRCAHLGVPLSDGSLEGAVITCSAHHYQYDACTGQGINPRTVRLTGFAVKVDGDEVLVDVAQATGARRQ